MILSEEQIALQLQLYFLPFVRIAAMLMVMPVVGSRVVAGRIRLVLAVALAVFSAPLVPDFSPPPLISLSNVLLILREITVGVLIGFVFQIVFQVFVLSGQFMAMKMGLGFAMMNDPTNGVQTTVVSQFFLILTTVSFVCVNGHLYLISAIVQSFQTLPIGGSFLSPEKLYTFTKLGAWMFATALIFSLPVLTSLLFVNITFGVMSRAAPQLNIFAVGFPFTLVCGLLLIWMGLLNYTNTFENSMKYGFDFVHGIIEAP